MNRKKLAFLLGKGLLLASLVVLPGCSDKGESTDIVIIGGGGAGMTAAIEAHNQGAKVILIEKMPMLGGNTVRAEGGLNAAGTPYQAAAGIVDSPELHYEDTMKGGKNLNNPDLVRTLTNGAAASVEWLKENGAELSEVGRAGGASVNRIHRPAGGEAAGNFIVVALKKKLEEYNIDVRLQTTANEIIKNKDGVVTGVKVTDKENKQYTINADSVILAAGGFGANMEMIKSYQPQLADFSTTNHPGATGDGTTMAEQIGAKLVDMKEIQIHPTTIPGQGVLITEGVRGDGAILVNTEGKRFTNELLTRDVVSQNILAQPGKVAYLIFNDELRANLKATEVYFGMDLVKEGSTPAELAQQIGIDAVALADTLERYNGFVASGTDTDFERADLVLSFEQGKYYAIQVTPGIHHTMGGVVINTQAQVLDTNDQIIKGLYAAGEVTGGVHGGNRLGGNALADIITFGRIAADEAVKSLNQ
ncbi:MULTISPECIES: flavocytochrome c [unclassified Paenibacillus]|uniref:flavocytochrome c n=1 Tax=unclassified Paenibacillus TaxID=185978 RepID=UPI002407705C|nr:MULTISPECIES: flavocytochrome c [unclassified Paenibacillus]MDF9841719.1 fumarate reductase flavoprotein subunit [Paenibacillus sp. PastF-2]MDF9848169.1 fumarate reductase flavoprotein subunit [Paenibacillus sp. PastM-2]MDF9854878.1 fumarate reductase flavoprotein subunit [Paenibacillus sp. PastF-1]MDH6480148.1 fumarate reductase flavoprotein subunit [Paenibacillus sp. PastH-2]MDH6507579.1 fumarate reductase flavoprotein subunit [Paenibacillus sp. PastM-3]